MLKIGIAGAAIALFASSASSASAAAGDSWVSVPTSIVINAPAAKVWARIGGFCDFPKLRNIHCSYSQGQGEIGTIRVLAEGTEEMKVGESVYSYAFFLISGARMKPRFHGNLQVIPSADNKTSTLIDTMVYDQAVFPADDARAAMRATIVKNFSGYLAMIKTTVEQQN